MKNSRSRSWIRNLARDEAYNFLTLVYATLPSRSCVDYLDSKTHPLATFTFISKLFNLYLSHFSTFAWFLTLSPR